MSLNWNITNVKDWEEIIADDDERVVLDTAIWLTVAVGMPQITEKNWRDFYVRVAFYEKLYGCMMVKNDDGNLIGVPFTADNAERLIGLHTNASSLTESQFKNHHYKMFVRNNKPSVKQETAV